MGINYVVKLTAEERSTLKLISQSGVEKSHRHIRARILLKADEGFEQPWQSDAEIAKAVGVSKSTVVRARQQFVEHGLEGLEYREPRSRPEKRKIDGESEAHLIALCCGDAPSGRAKWSLRLLADKLVELEYVEGTLSHHTVARVLKKTNLNLGRKSVG